MYLQLHKVLLFNSEGTLSYSGLKKVLLQVTETCYYLEMSKIPNLELYCHE